MRRPPVLIFAVLLAPITALRAQETASDTLLTVNHYLDWEQVADPQVSPDGSQILYTRRWVNQVEDRWDSGLWIMNADGSRNRFLVKGSSARWSPDGTRIAYFADGEPKGTQVFVRWMDAEGATSQVTHVSETPANLTWAPDGRSLAFTMLVKSETPWKISMPAAPEGAKWTPAPRIVDRLHYRRDRTGYIEQGTTQIFLVPAEGGTPRQLTTGDFATSELGSGLNYDWTPDGRTIVFDGLREADADYRYRESYLYAVDVKSGVVRQLVSKKGGWTGPVVSPDGRSVAFTGHEYGTFSYRADEVWVIGIDGSGLRSLTSYDRDPGTVRWSPDGSGVFFALGEQGTSNVYFAGVRGGNRRVTEGVQMLSLSSVARDFNAAGIRSDANDPPDVVRFNVRAGRSPITRLTNVNADVLDRIHLGSVEEVWYTSTGGTRVQGWIIKPPGFDRGNKYPLIMEIHGGPHGMYNGAFSYQLQNFAANGYVVLITNPRGSTGYGSAFGNAIERAYPSVDYDDLMAGVDTVVRRGYIDTQRMYGGGGALSGDRLDEHGGADGHPAVHLQLLRRAVLGKTGSVDQAVIARVRRQREDADTADDGRAGPADADAPDRGVLLGVEDVEGSSGDAALQRGVSRHVVQAVELPAHAALHDELVSEAPVGWRGGGEQRRWPALAA